METLFQIIVIIFYKIKRFFIKNREKGNTQVNTSNPSFLLIKDYKSGLKELLRSFNGNLAITFSFNKDVSCGLNVDILEKTVRKWNSMFFSKIFGSRYYKHNKIENFHIVEHLNSDIHIHSLYKIEDKEYLKDPKKWILKYENIANELFNKLWLSGTIYLDEKRDDGWIGYMLKEKHSPEDYPFFILP